MQYSDQDKDDPIELRIYPGRDGTFTLYDDAGTNYDYESGQSSRIVLNWKDSTHELLIGKRVGSFSGMPRDRSLVVHMAGATHASQAVRYRGEAIRLHLN